MNVTTGASVMRLFGGITAGTGLILLPIAVWLAVAPPAELTTSGDAGLTIAVLGGLGLLSVVGGTVLAAVGHVKVKRHRHVLLNGVATEGVITDLRASLTEINEQPMTIIDLVVRRPDGTTAPMTLKVLVPLALMNVIRPGLPLPVRLDPRRLDYAVIDWAAARRHLFGGHPVFAR